VCAQGDAGEISTVQRGGVEALFSKSIQTDVGKETTSRCARKEHEGEQAESRALYSGRRCLRSRSHCVHVLAVNILFSFLFPSFSALMCENALPIFVFPSVDVLSRQ